MDDRDKLPRESLKEYLNKDTVSARLKVTDREQAIDYVGNLLLRAGKIEARYISAMKRVLEELGAYSVIAPGIVLLHAGPEDGVLTTCFALVTLEDPICFGNPVNDPVDLVLAMGAVDHHGHIGLLAQLAELLRSSDFLVKIREAESSVALCNVVSEQIDLLLIKDTHAQNHAEG